MAIRTFRNALVLRACSLDTNRDVDWVAVIENTVKLVEWVNLRVALVQKLQRVDSDLSAMDYMDASPHFFTWSDPLGDLYDTIANEEWAWIPRLRIHDSYAVRVDYCRAVIESCGLSWRGYDHYTGVQVWTSTIDPARLRAQLTPVQVLVAAYRAGELSRAESYYAPK